MTDRKRCVRCGRAIDGSAGICPFCNWNQAEPAPAQATVAAAPIANLYVPPEEVRAKKAILFILGGVVMLFASFAIGMVINRDGAPKRAPEALEEQAEEHNAENLEPKRADTPLIFAGEGGLEQPITSAPAETPVGSVPEEYQRTDATAVSAEEYARMARRAQAERKRKSAELVDPRSISGAAYAQGRIPARRAPSNAVARASRTRPVPQFQPLPSLDGKGRGRFTMIVGADGRVKDVSVERAIKGGNTAAVVGAIQRWRFKPATENGRPIAAPYSVEISFRRE
jgi:hypothetical protein